MSIRTWFLWMILSTPNGVEEDATVFLDVATNGKPYMSEEACQKSGEDAQDALVAKLQNAGIKSFAILYVCSQDSDRTY